MLDGDQDEPICAKARQSCLVRHVRSQRQGSASSDTMLYFPFGTGKTPFNCLLNDQCQVVKGVKGPSGFRHLFPVYPASYIGTCPEVETHFLRVN